MIAGIGSKRDPARCACAPHGYLKPRPLLQPWEGAGE